MAEFCHSHPHPVIERHTHGENPVVQRQDCVPEQFHGSGIALFAVPVSELILSKSGKQRMTFQRQFGPVAEAGRHCTETQIVAQSIQFESDGFSALLYPFRGGSHVVFRNAGQKKQNVPVIVRNGVHRMERQPQTFQKCLKFRMISPYRKFGAGAGRKFQCRRILYENLKLVSSDFLSVLVNRQDQQGFAVRSVRRNRHGKFPHFSRLQRRKTERSLCRTVFLRDCDCGRIQRAFRVVDQIEFRRKRFFGDQIARSETGEAGENRLLCQFCRLKC